MTVCTEEERTPEFGLFQLQLFLAIDKGHDSLLHGGNICGGLRGKKGKGQAVGRVDDTGGYMGDIGITDQEYQSG